MSETLAVTRSAVWKHVSSLREAGYNITARPNKGYSLSEPLPFNAFEVSSKLKTSKIANNLLYFKELDSTNTKALQLAKEGATEGTTLIAETQSGGKGRLGKDWHSPPGVNIYTSIILRPKIAPQKAQSLTLMAAIAVAKTIEEFSPIKPSVKWPNDILVEGKKIAGILTEMSSETEQINHIALGIGINVNMKDQDFPNDICKTATSLAVLKGEKIDRAEVARALYSNVEKWYKVFLDTDLSSIIDTWLNYFTSKGKKICVSGTPPTEGICMGIDSDGALLIKNDDGTTKRVLSGEITSIY
ncbi:MAG: biotin--[acetyl-CoA-carboxylase] ligase [Deltaproteobacteria bacterium]|nr:biotin--[acetyl-CoA-carboxylase] ligase [Deltaproteobacteria bacterium]